MEVKNATKTPKKYEEKYIASFALAVMIASIFNVLLVMLKASVPAVFKWMAALTGHHWLTQALFVTVLFFILGIGLAHTSWTQRISFCPRRHTSLVVVASTLVLILFWIVKISV